ncbi:B3 domain-containing transcription factor VRN1-like [Cynara cardunculus var. scolymus]|uniref:B3 domain-containing transcription factor VRN1-like n=1 Tax=Cynara cardunculus var. scolymus TaxID=59895 RepID=UPI000D62ED0F|nr:B3 domain-containing transcription factor VRN1-like [Cynara cardunculus var. scolymus]
MESHRRLSFPADPFNFISIIVSNDIKSARIKIPEKFTERHGGNLPETVTLKVPNGDIWQVDLINSNGAIRFSNGWMEFAEHYNLRFGHLLMFKYEGLSNFRVLIFDPSACEMVYPKNRNHQLAYNSTEIKARSSLDSCIKVNLDDSKETVKLEQEACSSWGQDHETKIKIDGEREGEYLSTRVKEKGRKRAIEAAKARFASNKPFFMVYMTPFHIVGRVNVRIPLWFMKENGSGLKKVERCVLRVGMDKRYKKWEIDLSDRALRMGGWKMFMKDNGVSVDDVCVFELIDPHQNLLKVTIFRSSI